MSLTFHYPQLFALLLLLPLAWRWLAGRRRGVSSWLRLALIALAITAAARPQLDIGSRGTDLLLLVDRSASCGAESDRMLREIWPLLQEGQGADDRTAVIAFGDGARVERGFGVNQSAVVWEPGFSQASDLAEALKLASAIRAPERRTALLCLSDGDYTGDNPLHSSVTPALERLPFWYRRTGQAAGLDVAAGAITLPEQAEPRSAWLVGYAIEANYPATATYTLSRNGMPLAQATVELRPGLNRFAARDTTSEEGFVQYRLEVEADGDVVRGNNASTALLRVAGPPRVLIATHDGEAGLIASALAAAAIPVDIVRPGDFPEEPALLSPYKLVILENCKLSAFPDRAPEALATAVETGLTALLVTGGQNSFGSGGYHRSPLDPLLPVEMELRNELRRGTLAVAMALDRSGSMAMSAGGNRTKMDLANLGTAEAIRLLSPQDQVSVIAVDTASHIIIPLSMADDAENLAKLTLSIESMGGGIYCFTALQAAAAEVRKSTLPNRHIILFADASDSEEQDGCLRLARELDLEGIKISVIAMGTDRDPDAEFLKALSFAGGGETLFSDHAGNLPALFTQELLRISRRGFLEEPVQPRVLPTMSLVGLSGVGAGADTFPALSGYNVSARRDGSVVELDLDDEFATPLLATRVENRAVTAALLFEVDGAFSGNFAAWPDASGWLAGLCRWLAGGVERLGVKSYAGIRGGDGWVEFEFAPDVAVQALSGETAVEWLGPGGAVLSSPLEWQSPSRARSGLRLKEAGAYLPTLSLPERGIADAPPVTLSFGGEYRLRQEGEGVDTLRRLARLSGGGEGLDGARVRASALAEERGSRELTPYILMAVLGLFLVELSGRRLLWF